MNRRGLITGVSASAAILASKGLFAQPKVDGSDIEIVSDLPPLPSDLVSHASDNPAPYADVAAVGTGKPMQDEIEQATKLLLASPFDTQPVDVALYFASIGSGTFGASLREYAREWPVRANPMIYHFFSSTQTKPEGDVTAWCAAFVNWCILRAHAQSVNEIGTAPGAFSKSGTPFSNKNKKNFSTNSAASGSFRCWKEVSSPKRGDLIVLKDAGTDGDTKYCKGSGHVAFYLSDARPGWAQCCGGNQSSKGSNGAVTIANMGLGAGTRFLKFVSLRTS